ncbi:MAG: hypothetical protein U0V74_03075 [Chitinophagales bacterium]
MDSCIYQNQSLFGLGYTSDYTEETHNGLISDIDSSRTSVTNAETGNHTKFLPIEMERIGYTCIYQSNATASRLKSQLFWHGFLSKRFVRSIDI